MTPSASRTRIPRAILLILGSALCGTAIGKCPATFWDWKSWTQNELKKISASDKSYKDFLDEDLNPLSDKMQACQDELRRNPQALACLGNLIRFLKATTMTLKPGHSLGLEISDAKYFDSFPYPDMGKIPADLREPSFLKTMDIDFNSEKVDALIKTIEKPNQSISDPSCYPLRSNRNIA